MDTTISVKIAQIPHEDEAIIIIRKVLSEDNRIKSKYGLAKSGEWVLVPENKPYPIECWLPLPQNVRNIAISQY
jgi:hypothetical protein